MYNRQLVIAVITLCYHFLFKDMKNWIIKIYVPLFLVTMTLTGCDNPQYPDPEGERSTLSMTDFVLTAVDGTSITSAIIDVSQFTVNIRNSSDNEIVARWIYEEIPDEVALPCNASYIIEAYNDEAQAAAWNAPYYYASSQVRIYEDEVATAPAMQCTLANVAVSVSYSEAFRQAMGDDVKVTVTVAQGATLDFTPQETRMGYFGLANGASTLVATLTGTVDGIETLNRQVITGIEAGNHYDIKFSLDDEQ